MGTFRFVAHTADVAVKVESGSLRDLFATAAKAMFSVLAAKKANGPVRGLSGRTIAKTEEFFEDLLKAWLDELLFEFQTHGRILHRIKTLSCREGELRAEVLLCDLDRERYELKSEIKAVTYHELKVEKTRRGWHATIVFDV